MSQRIKKVISVILIGAFTVCSLSTSDSAMASLATKLKTKKLAMYVGEEATIKIKKKDKNCSYLFATNKKSVAKVNKKGRVTAVKKGTAKITVYEKEKLTKRIRKLGVCKVVVARMMYATPIPTPSITQEPEYTEAPTPLPELEVPEPTPSCTQNPV